jgi:hypothetical protein
MYTETARPPSEYEYLAGWLSGHADGCGGDCACCLPARDLFGRCRLRPLAEGRPRDKTRPPSNTAPLRPHPSSLPTMRRSGAPSRKRPLHPRSQPAMLTHAAGTAGLSDTVSAAAAGTVRRGVGARHLLPPPAGCVPLSKARPTFRAPARTGPPPSNTAHRVLGSSKPPPPSSSSSLSSPAQRCYTVLYTKDKHKKNKVWQDGVMRHAGKKLFLLDTEGKQLSATNYRNVEDTQAFGEETDLDEFSRYLVLTQRHVDNDEWVSGRLFLGQAAAAAASAAAPFSASAACRPPAAATTAFKRVRKAGGGGVLAGGGADGGGKRRKVPQAKHSATAPGALVLSEPRGPSSSSRDDEVTVVLDPILVRRAGPALCRVAVCVRPVCCCVVSVLCTGALKPRRAHRSRQGRELRPHQRDGVGARY